MADIQVYCYDNCPICGKSLGIDGGDTRFVIFYCPNECYALAKNSEREVYIDFYVFDYEAIIWENFSYLEKRSIENEVREQIAYWKENDRYLIKILEG